MLYKPEQHATGATKRARRRTRALSEPAEETYSPQKRAAINRLFRRRCSLESESHRQYYTREEPEPQSQRYSFKYDFEDYLFGNENEDPLLNSVPVNLDPEALGFLVCAQETLRFLHRRGFPPYHPVYMRLRHKFVRGINEITVA